MEVEVRNHTRYSTYHIESLLRDLLWRRTTFRGEDFTLVVGTYSPTQSHRRQSRWENNERTIGVFPLWVNRASEDLRIVSPNKMPIPLVESIAIAGSDYPLLPEEGVEEVCVWLFGKVFPRLTNWGSAGRRYYQEHRPRIAIEKKRGRN